MSSRPYVRSKRPPAHGRWQGKRRDDDCSMDSVDGVGDQQPGVVRGDGERLGDFAEAPLGDSVHGAD